MVAVIRVVLRRPLWISRVTPVNDGPVAVADNAYSGLRRMVVLLLAMTIVDDTGYRC